jgi:5-methylthioribose kinase
VRTDDGYRALDDQTIVDYVEKVPVLVAALGDGYLVAEEVGDGNLNQVFVVRAVADPQRSLIVKQALPYLRVSGPDWPLTRERMRFEIAALQLQNELVPDRVPTVHHADEAMSLVAMEFLAEHEVMRGSLIAGQRFPKFAEHIADFMAMTHYATSDMALGGEEKKALQRQFINPALCKLQEDFVFTNPYMESKENEWNPALEDTVRAVKRDWELKSAIAEIKDTYVTRAQALLHGDIHTGSIMVTAEDTKVIDPEFAFFGPIGYDLGTLFANLAINWAAHAAHSADEEVRAANQADVGGMFRGIWTHYATRFDQLWREGNEGELVPDGYWDFDGGADAFAAFRARYLRDILRDAAGHAGCEMLRRLMGIVTVPELGTIEDDGVRADVERAVHAVARVWLVDRDECESVDDLITVLESGG